MNTTSKDINNQNETFQTTPIRPRTISSQFPELMMDEQNPQNESPTYESLLQLINFSPENVVGNSNWAANTRLPKTEEEFISDETKSNVFGGDNVFITPGSKILSSFDKKNQPFSNLAPPIDEVTLCVSPSLLISSPTKLKHLPELSGEEISNSDLAMIADLNSKIDNTLSVSTNPQYSLMGLAEAAINSGDVTVAEKPSSVASRLPLATMIEPESSPKDLKKKTSVKRPKVKTVRQVPWYSENEHSLTIFKSDDEEKEEGEEKDGMSEENQRLADWRATFKIPERPTMSKSNNVYERLKKLLKANGQTHQNFNKLFEEGDEEDTEAASEKPTWNDPKDYYGKAVEKEESEWVTLKSKIIKVNKKTFANPYSRRTEHGRKNTETPFLLEIRSKLLHDGGWDMYELERYEIEVLKTKVSKQVYDKLMTGNPQRMDRQVRIFFAINAPELYNPKMVFSNRESEKLVSPFLVPEDFSEATIHNCFFLRFPDFSPLLPLRDIKYEGMFMEFLKDIRRTFYGMRSNFRKDLKRINGESITPKLSKGEAKWMEASFKRSHERCSGYHEFCNSEGVKEKIPGLVEARIREQKDEARHQGRPYKKQFHLSLLHSIKTDLWNELTDDEKANWRDVAIESNQEYHLSLDRGEALQMSLKAMLRSLLYLFRPLGVYAGLYMGYQLDGVTRTAFFETGIDGEGIASGSQTFRKAHLAMKECVRELVALKCKTDVSGVEHEDVEEEDAEDENNVDVDEVEEEGEEQKIKMKMKEEHYKANVPPFTFTRDDKPSKDLRKKMKKWFKSLLLAVLGPSVNRTDSSNSWSMLIRNQNVRFRNFPQNRKGKRLELKEFQHMSNDEIIIWRDHLIDSFSSSDNSEGYENPFKIVDKGGDIPILNPLTMGGNKPIENRPGKNNEKRGKDAMGKPSNQAKHGRKRKIKEVVDSDSEGMADDDRKPVIKARLSRKRKSKEYVADSDSDGTSSEPEARKKARKDREEPVQLIGVNQKGPPTPQRQSSRRPCPRPAFDSEVSAEVVKSYYLQTPAMQGTTLPVQWKQVEFRPDDLTSKLHRQHDAVKMFRFAFRELHQSLPQLFTFATRDSTRNKGIVTPSLFDFYATLATNSRALKSSLHLYHGTVGLPELRSQFSLKLDPVCSVLLDGLLDLELEIPHYDVDGGDQALLPSIGIDALRNFNSTVVKWIEDCLEKLNLTDTLKKSRIPSDQILLLMRALAFIKSTTPSTIQPSQVKNLYIRLVNTLSGITLYRYCTTVLEPIIDDLPKKITKRSTQLSALFDGMSDVIGAWIEYCESTLPKSFRDGLMVLGGNFPGVSSEKEDADALLATLDGLPWWSTSPSDYPNLLLSSRQKPIISVLSKLKAGDLWRSWTFMDKAAYIFIALAASGPLINQDASTEKARQALDRINSLCHILEGISKLLSDEVKDARSPKISFGKLNRSMEKFDENDSYRGSSAGSENIEVESPSKKRKYRKKSPNPQDSPSKRRRLSTIPEDEEGKS